MTFFEDNVAFKARDTNTLKQSKEILEIAGLCIALRISKQTFTSWSSYFLIDPSWNFCNFGNFFFFCWICTFSDFPFNASKKKSANISLPDSEFELCLELPVEVAEDSDTLLLLCMASIWLESNSKRRLRYLCSRNRFSLWLMTLRSLSSRDLMKCLALLSSPNVVCRELSVPTGTMSFSLSRQFLRWARRFFSNSLWVDLRRGKINLS